MPTIGLDRSKQVILSFDRVAQRRLALGISVKLLAERAGCSPSGMHKLLSQVGNGKPLTFNQAMKLARALEVYDLRLLQGWQGERETVAYLKKQEQQLTAERIGLLVRGKSVASHSKLCHNKQLRRELELKSGSLLIVLPNDIEQITGEEE